MICKKFRRFALCLAFTVLCTLISIPVNAEEYYTYDAITEFDYQFEYLSALGIFDEEKKLSISDEVTRSEYAAIVSKLSGYFVDGSNSKTKFDDVSSDEKNASYINYAVESGYMEASGSIFNPDAPVSTSTVLASIVRVLGYDIFYQNHSPEQIANELEITDKVRTYLTDTVTYGVLAQMLVNTLETYVVDFSGSYYSVGNETFLERQFRYTKKFGVVTTTEESSIVSNKVGVKNNIFIDNVQYDISNDYNHYLGYSVEFYVNDDDEIVFIRPRARKNTEVVLQVDNIESYSNHKYTYFVEGNNKHKTATLDYMCSVVYNKRVVTQITDDVLLPNSGSVRLLDNNNDGNYDVVFVSSYNVMEVNSVDMDKHIIYDKNNTINYINFDEAYQDEMLKVYKSGVSSTFESINPGDVILIYQSIEKDIADIYILNNVSDGIINSIDHGDNVISINSTEFDVVECCDLSNVNLSDNVRVYFDDNNNVVYVKKISQSGDMLGYLFKVHYEDFEEQIYLRLLDADNLMRKVIVEDKIRIDGRTYKSKDFDDASNYLTAFAEMKLIKFSYDDKGIFKVTTQNDTKSEHKLRVTYPKSNKKYISAMQSFYGAFGVSSNTVIFKIPTNNTEDYESYGVVKRSYFGNSKNYDVEAYSTGEGNLVADAILLYEEAEKVRETVGVVIECQVVLDEEDDTVKASITFIDHMGREQTYKTENLSAFDGISAGDFVCCGYDIKNEIKTVSVIYDYSEETYKLSANPSSDYAIGDRYAFGSVYEKHGTALGVTFDEITSQTTHSDCQVYETSIFKGIYKMDETLRKPVPVKASIDDVYDYIHSGGMHSKVLIYTNGETPYIIVIY